MRTKKKVFYISMELPILREINYHPDTDDMLHKYRIVEKDEYNKVWYEIEKRYFLFFWKPVGDEQLAEMNSVYIKPYKFNSPEDAKRYLKSKEFKKDRKRAAKRIIEKV